MPIVYSQTNNTAVKTANYIAKLIILAAHIKKRLIKIYIYIIPFAKSLLLDKIISVASVISPSMVEDSKQQKTRQFQSILSFTYQRLSAYHSTHLYSNWARSVNKIKSTHWFHLCKQVAFVNYQQRFRAENSNTLFIEQENTNISCITYKIW